ncbi:endonuclease domain-containing protein [Rhizobium sp. TRM96647]|uniref:endonuclease domain-containing protein n=1 Tax=unclassified Rhizobium TaxID=2613769 RepID=UPI0021E7AD55|nr:MULTISPECIES: endonuclease domain-containing protein [unclassified Rhizobium]MCV3738102.1 endonuclease domain-containing protein [Rhizobium sp. TRM96647]MCV3759789.1 endonuclease domain-containing protein [Rhizobium sp. TRM96650]
MRGANSSKTERARKLRQVENDAEGLLWSELRGRRLNGFKFVRQVPIGPYFADFACRERMLVVEVDGSHHADNAYDARRNEFMNTNGWSVARFWNTEVLRELKSVLETIVAICDGRLVERTHAADFTFLPVTERS